MLKQPMAVGDQGMLHQRGALNESIAKGRDAAARVPRMRPLLQPLEQDGHRVGGRYRRHRLSEAGHARKPPQRASRNRAGYAISTARTPGRRAAPDRRRSMAANAS